MADKILSLAGRLPRRLVRHCLILTAALCLFVAWWRYPAENHFSILRCTISFLGSPDPIRNPHGWRFFQAGMTALLLLLFSLMAERHVKFRRQFGRTALCSSAAISIALTLILLATWIPDSREAQCFGIPTGPLHTRLAILAIPFMGAGLLLDALALWCSGVRFRALWPFHLYALIVLVGAANLIAWEQMCRHDPTLPHWPGNGLHSTPLWEWIAFTYLIGFMTWMTRTATLTPGTPKGRSDQR